MLHPGQVPRGTGRRCNGSLCQSGALSTSQPPWSPQLHCINHMHSLTTSTQHYFSFSTNRGQTESLSMGFIGHICIASKCSGHSHLHSQTHLFRTSPHWHTCCLLVSVTDEGGWWVVIWTSLSSCCFLYKNTPEMDAGVSRVASVSLCNVISHIREQLVAKIRRMVKVCVCVWLQNHIKSVTDSQPHTHTGAHSPINFSILSSSSLPSPFPITHLHEARCGGVV